MKLSNENLLALAFKKCRRAFITIGIFSFFVNLLMLTVPLYMLQVFSRVLASFSTDTLIFLTAIAIFALMIYALLDSTRFRIVINISNWLDEHLSPQALQRSADEILEGRNYGGQSLRDILSMRNFLTSTGLFALYDSMWSPLYLLVIFLMHPSLGIIALISAILLFSIAIFNELSTHKVLAKANRQILATQTEVDSAFKNSEVIQAMGLMPNIINRWQKKSLDARETSSQASRRNSSFLSLSKFIRLTAQISILGFGAYLASQNIINAGVMIAASILMSRALAPIEQSISIWKQMVATYGAYQRLKAHFSHPHSRSAGIQLPMPKGKLDVEQLIYTPKGCEKPILFNLNIHIPAGSMVAIVGPTGAGKSTLARIIVGAYKPTHGKIRLDGADAYTWDREDFGRHIGYLPQDVELFPGTISENIARLEEDIDEEAVIAAAKLAGVHDLILRLPQGYATSLSVSQKNLSGGQKQRIALARALYKNPKVIVLDEPNASLDAQGEKALAEALMHMKAKKATQLIITHKNNILSMVDYIIALKDGKILLSGTKDDVLSKMKQMSGAA